MYYRLYDKQTGAYLATGYNSESLENLENDYISYKEIDDSEEDPIKEIIKKHGIVEVLKMDDFIVESSEIKFDEIDDF